MKSFSLFLLATCPHPLFHWRFAKRNPHLFTLQCKQLWKTILLYKNRFELTKLRCWQLRHWVTFWYPSTRCDSSGQSLLKLIFWSITFNNWCSRRCGTCITKWLKCLPNDQRHRSDSQKSNWYWFSLPGPGRKNNSSFFLKSIPVNERNTAGNSNNQENKIWVRFSDKTNTTKRHRSYNSQRSIEEKCRHCGRSKHSSRESKFWFKCGKIGHFRHENRARRQNLH